MIVFETMMMRLFIDSPNALAFAYKIIDKLTATYNLLG